MVAVKDVLNLLSEFKLKFRENAREKAILNLIHLLSLLIDCIPERKEAICILVALRNLDLLSLVSLNCSAT